MSLSKPNRSKRPKRQKNQLFSVMQVCLSENERKNRCPQYAVLERVRELSEMIDDEYDDEPVKIEEYQASVEMQNTIRQYLDIMEKNFGWN